MGEKEQNRILIVGLSMVALLLPYLGAPLQATLLQALQVRPY